jgi:hypothetical protein
VDAGGWTRCHDGGAITRAGRRDARFTTRTRRIRCATLTAKAGASSAHACSLAADTTSLDAALAAGTGAPGAGRTADGRSARARVTASFTPAANAAVPAGFAACTARSC